MRLQRVLAETFSHLYGRLYFIAILVIDLRDTQILINYYKLNKKAYIYIKTS